jgi:hypothetical protein
MWLANQMELAQAEVFACKRMNVNSLTVLCCQVVWLWVHMGEKIVHLISHQEQDASSILTGTHIVQLRDAAQLLERPITLQSARAELRPHPQPHPRRQHPMWLANQMELAQAEVFACKQMNVNSLTVLCCQVVWLWVHMEEKIVQLISHQGQDASSILTGTLIVQLWDAAQPLERPTTLQSARQFEGANSWNQSERMASNVVTTIGSH